jgi:DNA-binding transcriptional MocR family regulator
VDLLSRRDAAKLLGVSERSLGRQREQLQALGLVVKRGGRMMYRQQGLEEGYLSVAGLQVTNAENFERLQQVADGDAPHLPEALREPSIDDEDEEIPEPGKIPPWAESRAAREYWLSEKERLNVERQQGKLLDREAVERSGFEAGRQLRDAFQRFAVHLPPRMKHCASMAEQTILIQSMCHELLTDLSNGHRSAIDEQVAKQQREATK